MKPPCIPSRSDNRFPGQLPGLIAASVGLLMLTGISAAGDEATVDPAADGKQPLVSYYRPPGTSARGVLIVPGDDEPQEAWAAIADSMRRSGFHVLLPRFFAREGNANGRTSRRERGGPSGLDAGPTAMDVQEAICYLRDLPDASVRELALVGSGSGGSRVLGIGEIDFERLSFVCLSPRGGSKNCTDAFAPTEGDHPLLLIVTTDDVLGIETAAAILDDAPGRECWIVDGRGHGVELLRSRPDLVSRLTVWISHSLGEGGREP